MESASFAVPVCPSTIRVTDFTRLAHYIAKRVQRNPYDQDEHDDLVQDGFVALLEAIDDYVGKGLKIDNPSGWAAKVMSRGMLKTAYRRPKREEELEDPDAYAIIEGADEFYEQVLFLRFYEEVERVLGPRARLIAENLVDPSPQAIAEMMKDHSERQEEKAQGEDRRYAVDSVMVTKLHIRSAIGGRGGPSGIMSVNEFWKSLKGIQRIAVKYLGDLADSVAPTPNYAT
jgi:RNA polymerase sigma factor (sigma-70 family)